MISRAWNPRLAALLLGVVAYAPALSTGFLYDDHILIESNPSLRSWSPKTLKQDFTTGMFHHPGVGVDFYRPLQTLSTRLEFTLWGLRPAPYHFTNLLFHLANILLLFEFLIVLGTGTLVAGLASALFAVHPIIVEDLLMVSGRGELMGLFFMLACFLLFLRGGRWGAAWSLVSYVLAVFSKESAVIAPGLLAAVLVYQRAPLKRYAILIPMALITAIFLGLRHLAMGPLPDWSSMYPGRFFLIAFPQALWGYLGILLFPLDLHTDRLLSLPLGSAWPVAALLTAALAIRLALRGPRWAALCAVGYVLIFLPKSILMMAGGFMSDHWAYPALPAVAVPIALALARGWSSPLARTRTLARAITGLVLCAGVTLTTINILTRNTDEKLYRSALRYSTSSTMKYNLGMVLLHQGRPEEALPYLEEIAATDPNNPRAIQSLADVHEALRSVGKVP